MSAGAARQEGQSALTFYYVHPDHLGSISVVTDRDGAVKQKCTYDAWGRRTLVQGSLIFDRGFTGHEHLDEFALINMNGRMYDPVIGRFLSPDPYVQDPLFAQSFNRYSYAWNNPLIYTDPDGEFLGLALFILGSGLMKMVFDGQQFDGSWSWKAAGKGFLQGMALSGAMVGSVYLSALPGMLGTTGFFPSALLYGGGSFVSSAVTSGVTSWNMTGSFNVDWKSAAIMGGISGLMGGIGGYQSAKAQGFNKWTGVGTNSHGVVSTGVQSGTPVFKTDEELKAYLKSRNIDLSEYNVKDISMYDPHFSSDALYTYVRESDGNLYRFSDVDGVLRREPLGGLFERRGMGFFTDNYIHMSPQYSLFDFNAVFDHEWIHAFHFYMNPYTQYNYTESIAYSYNYKIGYHKNILDVTSWGRGLPVLSRGYNIPSKLLSLQNFAF